MAFYCTKPSVELVFSLRNTKIKIFSVHALWITQVQFNLFCPSRASRLAPHVPCLWSLVFQEKWPRLLYLLTILFYFRRWSCARICWLSDDGSWRPLVHGRWRIFCHAIWTWRWPWNNKVNANYTNLIKLSSSSNCYVHWRLGRVFAGLCEIIFSLQSRQRLQRLTHFYHYHRVLRTWFSLQLFLVENSILIKKKSDVWSLFLAGRGRSRAIRNFKVP